MKKCCFVIPYFGRFNNYFQLFLNSCAKNPSFDWLILTDDDRSFCVPPNVHIHPCSFEKVRTRIQALCDFPIYLEHPYKLCDFKPTYGEAFSDLLADYKFWGFCDVDLIFGNISSFITDQLLENHDRIGARGHLTIYRNTKRINQLYKMNAPELPIDFHYAFTTPYTCHFDEFEPWTSALKRMGLRQWAKPMMADINCNSYAFHLAANPVADAEHQIFSWQDGIITRHYMQDAEMKEDTWCYLHLQKRKMHISTDLKITADTPLLIIPNEFLPAREIHWEDVLHFSRVSFYDKLYFARRKQRFNEVVKQIKDGALRFRWQKIKTRLNR